VGLPRHPHHDGPRGQALLAVDQELGDSGVGGSFEGFAGQVHGQHLVKEPTEPDGALEVSAVALIKPPGQVPARVECGPGLQRE